MNIQSIRILDLFVNLSLFLYSATYRPTSVLLLLSSFFNILSNIMLKNAFTEVRFYFISREGKVEHITVST